MNATEEWLRYIENRSIMQTYGVKGYQNDSDDSDDSTKESEEV